MNVKVLSIHHTITNLVQVYDGIIASYELEIQRLKNENESLRSEYEKLVHHAVVAGIVEKKV